MSSLNQPTHTKHGAYDINPNLPDRPPWYLAKAKKKGYMLVFLRQYNFPILFELS